MSAVPWVLVATYTIGTTSLVDVFGPFSDYSAALDYRPAMVREDGAQLRYVAATMMQAPRG